MSVIHFLQHEISDKIVTSQSDSSTQMQYQETAMNKTILYIEDNMDNAMIVKGILSHEGYTVYIAHDGVKGLALAEYFKPDVIITDFHLPDINGPEIVKMLRSKNSFQNTPIMMLTADIYNQPVSQAAGIDSYLNKPIRRNQLVVAVKKLIVDQNKTSNSP